MVIEGKHIVALILVVIVLAFSFQGTRGIWSPDEGFYIPIAKTMLSSGDFLIPKLNDETWLEKPPLLYWGIAAGMFALGENELGARAFTALCFVLTTVIVFLLGKSMWGKREGTIAGVIYCTTIIPFAASNIVTPDTPLVLWTTLAFFFFWQSVKPGASKISMWKLLMCASFGLGFISKGPAAIIPAAGMFAFLLFRGKLREYFITTWALAGFAIFSVLGLSWYFMVGKEEAGAIAYFFDNQVVGRTISEKYNRNPGVRGAFIYLPVLLFGTLPWSFIWYSDALRRRCFINPKSWWLDFRKNPVNLFIMSWFVVPFIILLAANSRLPLYLLPLFPAISLATARKLSLVTLETQKERSPGLFPKHVVLVGTWVILLIGFKLAAAYYPSERDMRSFWRDIAVSLPGSNNYEFIVLDEYYEGLSFYGLENLEMVTKKKKPYPCFVMPENLKSEIKEIALSNRQHVIICEGVKSVAYVCNELRLAGVGFKQSKLSFDRWVIICKPEALPIETRNLFPADHKAT
ncbi:MAG: glycosyltransferase family 39 protein [Candidatus Schekmanbacteria bacterium]|nr:glycosyltransferase family 39 protein [Candidatus Schekmanbacteria bacterium]